MRTKRLCVARFTKRLKSSLRVILSFLMMAAASPLTSATDSTVLKIATRPNLPPYIQKDASHGIEIDVVRAVFEEANLPIEFVQMDRVEMISRFENGEMQGSLTMSTTATTHGCVTNWYIVHQNVGFSLFDNNVELKSLKDLASLKVVSFHNATTFLGSDFRAAVENNENYQEIAPQSRHIDLLYRGDFDVVVGDEWIIRYVQRQHFEKTGEYKVVRVHPIMSPTLYSARFQKQQTCDVFNAALRSLRRNGTYDRIVDDYHQRLLIAAKSNEVN